MRYVDSLILLLSYENYFWQTGSRFVTSAALLLFIPTAQRSFQPEKVKSGDHLCKQRSVHCFTIPRPPKLSTKTPSRDRYLHKLTDKDWWSPILSSDTFRNTFLAQNEDCFVYHLLQWTLIRKGCHHGSYEQEEWSQQDQPVHMSTWPLFWSCDCIL